MNVKINEVMADRVISCQPHQTVEHVRGMMETNRIHAVPVVGPGDELVGIVSTMDLAAELKNAKPVSQVMTKDVFTIPAYDDVHVAARVMRNHRLHHLVVTNENKVVGMLSSFDLLKLVEGRRFTAKNAPTPSKKRAQRQ